jgi:hypothetical protein
MKRLSKVVFFATGSLLLLIASITLSPMAVEAAKEAALLVRDQDNPARSPFQASCVAEDPSVSCVLAVVPEGKRLVIQGTTFRAFVNPGTGSSVEAYILTTVNGGLVGHYVGMQDLGPAIRLAGQPHEYTAVLPITIYADPGTSVSVSFNRGFEGPEYLSFTGTITGYTVSLP